MSTTNIIVITIRKFVIDFYDLPIESWYDKAQYKINHVRQATQ